MAANVESMFYVGKMPWHKEGIQLNDPPNTNEAIRMAGLDWKVAKTQLFTSEYQLVKNYYGIIRTDNQKVLGVVGNGYTPLQNSDAFNFFDPLLNQRFLEYETAGSLGEGEIIWVLAKIKNNGNFSVKGDDIVEKYLLLSNSHDGKSAVSVKFTPIRVVCQNTLSLALSQGETTRIKHVVSMHDKLNDVQIAISNIAKIYSTVENRFKEMYEFKMSDKDAKIYFNNIFPLLDTKDVKSQAQRTKQEQNIKIQEKLFRNFHEGLGVREFNISNTLWAAYNSVTEFIDHPEGYKLGDNKLLKRIWFGEGEVIKKRAYLRALEKIKSA